MNLTTRTIVGIDPSLTATAVCPYSMLPNQPDIDVFSSTPAVGLQRRIGRYQLLTKQVVAVVKEAEPAAVFIEGHSFGSRDRGTIDRAEYRGILSAALLAVCPHVYEVPPATLKLFITGKGNANKTIVITACVKHYGVEYKTDDAYDAYGLCRLGACVLGWEPPTNAAQKRAIEKLKATE